MSRGLVAALSRKRVFAWGRDESGPCLECDASRVREDARSASTCQVEEDGLPPYPERPYVPLVLLAALAFVGSQSLALQGFSGMKLLLLFASIASLLVMMAIWLAGASWSLVVGALALSVAVVAGGLEGGWALARVDDAASAFEGTSVSSCEFVVRSDCTRGQSGWLCRAEAMLGDGGRAKVWLTLPDRVEFGSMVTGIGRFSANGDDDWGRTSRSQGLCGKVKMVRVSGVVPATGAEGVLAFLRSWALRAIDPSSGDGRALMAGLVAGSRADLKERGLDDAFASVGLSHLIAVSGAHLAVMAGGVETLLGLAGVGLRVRTLSVLASSAAYVVFCACPSSAVRAWVMLLASRCGRSLGRRSHSPSGVAVACLAMCALDPYCSCDLGFRLSVSSVIALALFGSYADALLARISLVSFLRKDGIKVPYRLRRRGRALLRSLRSAIAVSLVCQLATAGTCTMTFGRLSLVSTLANVLIGPLFTPLVSLGLAGAAISWLPFLGSLVLSLDATLCEIVICFVRGLGKLPLACIPVCLPPWAEYVPLVAMTVVLVVWPRPSRRALLGTILAATVVAGAYVLLSCVLVGPSVTILDVGQGDAILIRQGPHAILVDCGLEGSLSSALARNHVYHLDAVVITHLHDDHYGGVDDLVGLIGVDAVYVGEGASGNLPDDLEGSVRDLTGAAPGEIADGDVLRLGSYSMRCVWPHGPTDGSENEDSLCFVLSYDGDGCSLEMLLTGDAEQEQLGEYQNKVGDIDVLKVGHHGSRVSISLDQAMFLRPEFAVASAGEGNSYGHPTSECIETLESAGATFLCTIERGDVRVEPSPDNAPPRVVCQR